MPKAERLSEKWKEDGKTEGKKKRVYLYLSNVDNLRNFETRGLLQPMLCLSF